MLGLAGHSVGLLAGAVGVAAAWHWLGTLAGHPPRWALGLLAVLLALVAGELLPLRLPGSPWRVPRSWGRLGHVGYASVFGIALGTGLATALPSPGLYALVAWGLAAPGWPAVWPVFGAFAAGRAVPLLVVAAHADRRRGHPDQELETASRIASRLSPAESMLFAALAVIWLSG